MGYGRWGVDAMTDGSREIILRWKSTKIGDRRLIPISSIDTKSVFLNDTHTYG